MVVKDCDSGRSFTDGFSRYLLRAVDRARVVSASDVSVGGSYAPVQSRCTGPSSRLAAERRAGSLGGAAAATHGVLVWC